MRSRRGSPAPPLARRRGDRVLLAAMLLPWAVILALHLSQLVRSQYVRLPPIVYTDAAPGAYPTVLKLVRPGPAPDSALQVGDVVLRVGDRDVRGLGFLGVSAHLFDQCAPCDRMPLWIERQGQARAAELELARFSWIWGAGGLIVGLSFTIFAALILLRAPPSRETRLLAAACVTYSASILPIFAGSSTLAYAQALLSTAFEFFMQPLMLLALDGVMRLHLPSAVREPRWPWLFSLSGLLYSSAFFGWPLSNQIAWILHPISNILFIAVLILLMGLRYRRVDAEGRRRFKWIGYGIVFGTLPLLVANVVVWIEPNLQGALDWCMLSTVLVPACLFIAMVRHRLFDIDRLISVTATYSLIGIGVIAALLMFAPRVAHAASGATGIAAHTLQAWLSFAIACLLLPGQKLLRPWLDRLFFRERQALESGMEQLLEDLSACAEPHSLFELAGSRLDALIDPESCVLYSRTGAAFAPVFARAATVPPAFAADGDLIAMLRARRVALELGRQARLPAGSVDRAALEALGSALALPIHHHGELAAFLCLGHKRSGDVYINTDLALLGTVAQRVTMELQGFDAAQVRRQSQDMQSALRRYVPGAVAEHIEQGRELDAAEREISVLFVDIRGYTRYSEARSAAEIFDTVNRYTGAVSAVVRRHGGTVVEFNGDGLMVVFGAPTAIAHKERAAVAAAREAVTAVRALALGAGEAAAGGLDVGIGIATGSAFVGNIRSADRMIWGAIGNTTNLAARLQSLSRELEASIVIDAATRDADPGALADFQCHPQLAIRGRQRREDVYALPL